MFDDNTGNDDNTDNDDNYYKPVLVKSYFKDGYNVIKAEVIKTQKYQ